ncbi:hypothetical protein B0H34DRAFT_801292 [Crassisporium funariophilum]|nr:hypothetical protein B0H34DRAFT_801292 [Crassisporium funariophilum]
MSPPSLDPDDVASGIHHLTAGKYFQVAAFVMLIYDHLLTFPREVERIWKQPQTGATFLFLLVRYATLLEFIIIIDAFQDPKWTKDACNRFVQFEGASTTVLVGLCELIMILRVYAFYGRSTYVLSFLMLLWAVQIAISAIGLNTGFAVPLPPGQAGCILTGTSRIFPSLWVAPLVTDTCIFVLTLWRSRQLLREAGKTPTLQIFLRDGVMYFFIIFLANLANTVIYIMSPEDLKAVGASFSQLITAVMVSRLVLNLRPRSPSRSYTTMSNAGDTTGLGSSFIGHINQTRDNSFMSRTVLGNLGADCDNFDTDDSYQDVDMLSSERETTIVGSRTLSRWWT